MPKKKVAKSTSSYEALHKNLKTLTPSELKVAMQNELNRDEPRHDMLKRLVGRYNKVRGRRSMEIVMGLLTAKGNRDVHAALSSDR